MRADDLGFRERYRPPKRPLTEKYARMHRTFVRDMLDDDGIVARFAESRPLPRAYGVGLDERVVEYPWVFSRSPAGRVLDAGSTLNHGHILDRLLGRIESLHIVTLAPEPQAFVERGVSYLFADLRDLPIRDGYYDTVVCVSTLDHVGMDTSPYGVREPKAADPATEVELAVAELGRVLRPGGRLLVTVPYGRRMDGGWFRQFDRDDLRALLAAAGGAEEDVSVYAYSRRGWQLSDLDAAAEAEYRDALADATPVVDLAAAARAVACFAVERQD
jgi:SAM-dependent methyltransferase